MYKVKDLDKKTQRIISCLDYDKIICFDFLLDSFELCRKGLSWKPRIRQIENNYPVELLTMAKQLKDGKYEHKKQLNFTLHERGKIRLIDCVDIYDRIIEKSLCENFLLPIFGPSFVHSNSASQKNKGTSFSKKLFRKHLQGAWNKYGEEGYILHYDIKKFFHTVSSELVFQKMKDYLYDSNLDSAQRCELDKFLQLVEFYLCNKPTLTLGNQSSQIAALFALSKLDHYCTDFLHIKYYGRYMDDGYLILPNKEEAVKMIDNINNVLEEMCLELHPVKTFVEPLSNMKCNNGDAGKNKQYPIGGVCFLKRKFVLNDKNLVEMYATARTVRMTIKKNKNKYRKSVYITNKVKKQHLIDYVNGVVDNEFLFDRQEALEQIYHSDGAYKDCKNVEQVKNQIIECCRLKKDLARTMLVMLLMRKGKIKKKKETSNQNDKQLN